jgi:hypothetical protein
LTTNRTIIYTIGGFFKDNAIGDNVLQREITMDNIPKDDQWVWVLIQNPGENEQILGQHDKDRDRSFIPVFLEKEAAQKCYHFLARDAGIKDEFQAMIYEDLARHAADNDFLIFTLGASGEILETIAP